VSAYTTLQRSEDICELIRSRRLGLWFEDDGLYTLNGCIYCILDRSICDLIWSRRLGLWFEDDGLYTLNGCIYCNLDHSIWLRDNRDMTLQS
jgi:hypothetical protein